MTDDLMTRARQAIEAEETARLEAKAAELASADDRARLQAEQEARRQQARETATKALNAPGVTLPDLARQFDTAVAALVELAKAADQRNRVIQEQATALAAADVFGASSRGGSAVDLDGEIHSIRDAKPAELLARAVAVAASEVGTPGNGLKQLASDLLPHSGPLARRTAVERAQR
ncbi:hypothetical protein ACH4VX_13380 [Streptomyces sp. NPDC020731]|uniref:hypothetical protein n=1 Tax=Streptomyces sp. NPDC020731 TaxID=3365085 RepID=UPI0037BC238E